VRTLVQWKDDTVRRLNEIPRSDSPVTFDQIAVLQDIYPRLWKLYLLVRPELRWRGHSVKLEFLRVLKEKTGLTAKCDPAFENYLEKGCNDYKIGTMFHSQFEREGRYIEMPARDKDSTWLECRSKLLALAPHDDFEDSADALVVASHNEAGLRGLVRRIVETVLRKRRVSKKS